MTEPRARNEVGYGEQKGSKQRRFARQAASADQRPHHHDSRRRDAETHPPDNARMCLEQQQTDCAVIPGLPERMPSHIGGLP
jgi:hypothetical protein